MTISPLEGHPPVPAKYTHVKLCMGVKITMDTNKRVFVISTAALIILSTLFGYFCGIYPTSLALKICFPAVTLVTSIISLDSYWALAKNYDIAPPGFYSSLSFK